MNDGKLRWCWRSSRRSSGVLRARPGRFLTLEAVKSQQAASTRLVDERPLATAADYFAVYVAVTALSLPGAATVLTLAGGALFGLVWGVVIVSFASTIGATLAFLSRASCCATRCRRASATGCGAIDEGVASATAPSTCSRCG